MVTLLMLCSVAFAYTPTGGGGDPESVGETRHLVMMIVYATIALGFSFLCSVAEAVVLSISPSFIANKEKEGKSSAKLLTGMKKNIDRTLAGILTLNTIAHTVGAGGAGAEAASYFGDQYVGIAMAVLTLLILFLSEIIPKTLGAVFWRQLATPTGYFVKFLTIVLYPLIVISEFLTKLLTRGKSVHGLNREEFAAMAEIVAEGGHLDPKESRILRNLFRFPTLQAQDIMTPSTVVFALQQDLTVAEVNASHPEISFTRIPLYGENRDDITGFVLKTDILLNSNTDAPLSDFKRELRAVKDETPLSQVLEDLLDTRSHVLLVVDQYGGLEGLVTLEDVVETLIGAEIVDEADKIDDMRRLARDKWEQRMKKAGIDLRTADGQEEAT